MEAKPPAASRWLRPMYAAAGLVAVGVGVAGIFLPLVPTVGPLLIGAWCFARSSDRLYRWLVGHPRLGRIIAPFRSGLVTPRRTKAWVMAAMALSFGISGMFLLNSLVPRLVLGAVALVAFVTVWRIPTAPRDSAPASSPSG
ncbi:MAG: YbaN family protein [Acidimicrobiia bacterium]|nr:YbaN family protein [Acidimicrobiia bacterium]